MLVENFPTPRRQALILRLGVPVELFHFCYYSNYMKANVIRIGNSRGLRLPYQLLELYRLKEGDELELEERPEGIMLRPQKQLDNKLSWEDAYRQMSTEAAEQAEWSEWDSLSSEALND